MKSLCKFPFEEGKDKKLFYFHGVYFYKERSRFYYSSIMILLSSHNLGLDLATGRKNCYQVQYWDTWKNMNIDCTSNDIS